MLRAARLVVIAVFIACTALADSVWARINALLCYWRDCEAYDAFDALKDTPC